MIMRRMMMRMMIKSVQNLNFMWVKNLNLELENRKCISAKNSDTTVTIRKIIYVRMFTWKEIHLLPKLYKNPNYYVYIYLSNFLHMTILVCVCNVQDICMCKWRENVLGACWIRVCIKCAPMKGYKKNALEIAILDTLRL